MSRLKLFPVAAAMFAALWVEATVLPHWIPGRWVPQISFLIMLFAALKGGVRAGGLLGAGLGLGYAVFAALPAVGLVWIYAGLGAAAGAAKRLVFLESPLAQWLAPIGFGLIAETIFFWMMPADDGPLGFGDFCAMIGASNLPITWFLSGFVYLWCDRRLFSASRRD